jgi:hypothetical protein
MNFIQRSFYCLSATVILLLATAPAVRAQTAVTDSTDIIMVQGSQIAWNFFRLIGGNANKFSHYKGDLVEKLSSGITAYKVNDLNDVGVNNEYIMVNPDGATFYWGHITGDQAKLRKFLIAFTIGVCVYGKRNDLPIVSKPDPALTTGDTVVYNLVTADIKVGTFTEDKSKKTIDILIGLLH